MSRGEGEGGKKPQIPLIKKKNAKHFTTNGGATANDPFTGMTGTKEKVKKGLPPGANCCPTGRDQRFSGGQGSAKKKVGHRAETPFNMSGWGQVKGKTGGVKKNWTGWGFATLLARTQRRRGFLFVWDGGGGRRP